MVVADEQAARQALKDAKDEADYREHNFQKELATSQKLAALYKEANDERSRKVTELEGVIRELQDHLKVLGRRRPLGVCIGSACLALSSLGVHCGKLAIVARTGRRGGARGVQGDCGSPHRGRRAGGCCREGAVPARALSSSERPPASSRGSWWDSTMYLYCMRSHSLLRFWSWAAHTLTGSDLRQSGMNGGSTSGPMVAEGMSHTELYTKFVEATTQCRQEALAKRQMEITMELVILCTTFSFTGCGGYEKACPSFHVLIVCL